MQKKLTTAILFLTLFFFGCATATFTQGRDFDSSKVSQIQKGKTTKSDVLSWFGEPFQKSVSAEGSETLVYSFTKGTSHAQSYVFSMEVKTEGNLKRLEVKIKDGVVENYSFSDGGLPGAVK